MLEKYSCGKNAVPIYDDGASELRYYRKPPKYCDLKKGFDIYIRKPDDFNAHIVPLLGSIKYYHEQYLKTNGLYDIHDNRNNGANSQRGKPVDMGSDFVMFRGMMSKIMATPYAPEEGWKFGACKFGGAIYIDELPTEQKLERMQKNTSLRNQQMCYWGYKFEDYCTVNTLQKAMEPPKDEDFTGPVDDSLQFCNLFQTALDDKKLLLSAEIDCIMPGRNEKEYVELKTNRVLENEWQVTRFEKFKLLKFWIQSFLANIPYVIVGFRDDNGIVRSVQKFNTLEIPKLGNVRKYWDAN
eukprot:Ihof_evm5s94 gene=Ihof_evmTU5s94